jgi:hypothetical protein
MQGRVCPLIVEVQNAMKQDCGVHFGSLGKRSCCSLACACFLGPSAADAELRASSLAESDILYVPGSQGGATCCRREARARRERRELKAE